MKKFTPYISMLIFACLVLWGVQKGLKNRTPGPPTEEADSGPKDFTLKDLNDRDVTISEYLKDNVVLVKFGATWCPGCNQMTPIMKRINDEYAHEGLKVLEIDILDEKKKETKEKVEQHVRDNQIFYDVVLDEKGKMADNYSIYTIPTFFIAKKGKMNYLGNIMTYESLKYHVEKALEPDPN